MKLIAHGGYSSKHPENTEESYKAALEHNPDGLEMDVVYYQGEVYFYHPEGNKIPFGEEVDDLIFQQLEAKVDVDKLLKLSNRNQISRYLEQLEFLLLDIKQKSTQNTVEILNKIKELGYGKKQIFVGIRQLNTIINLELQDKMTLVSLDQNPNTYKMYIDAGFQYIRVWYKDLTQELVDEIHSYGGKIIVNHKMKVENSISRDSGNYDLETIYSIYSMNADLVIINDIKLGREFLDSIQNTGL